MIRLRWNVRGWPRNNDSRLRLRRPASLKSRTRKSASALRQQRRSACARRRRLARKQSAWRKKNGRGLPGNKTQRE